MVENSEKFPTDLNGIPQTQLVPCKQV